MPYITDKNDFIKITSNQNSELFALYHRKYVLGLMNRPMGFDELELEKEKIVKNSLGYSYIPGSIQTRIYKEVLI